MNTNICTFTKSSTCGMSQFELGYIVEYFCNTIHNIDEIKNIAELDETMSMRSLILYDRAFNLGMSCKSLIQFFIKKFKVNSSDIFNHDNYFLQAMIFDNIHDLYYDILDQIEYIEKMYNDVKINERIKIVKITHKKYKNIFMRDI